MPGPLALVGGGEFSRRLHLRPRPARRASGATRCSSCRPAPPTSTRDRLVDAAVAWFDGLGATVRGLDVLRRPDALDAANADAVRGAGLRLPGRRVADAPALGAQGHAGVGRDRRGVGRRRGARRIGRPAPWCCCDPMVDPRGGAFTLGLGLLANLAVIPEFDLWSRGRDPPHPQAEPGRPRARRRAEGHRAAPRPRRLVAGRRRRRGDRVPRRRARRPRRAAAVAPTGSGLGDRHRFDRDRLRSACLVGAAERVDRLDDVVALGHLAEERVRAALQARRVDREEELAAGVRCRRPGPWRRRRPRTRASAASSGRS